MLINRNFHFPPVTTICSGSYEEPEVCPICKHALKPEELGIYTFQNNDNGWHISALYLCRHCYQTFLTFHQCSIYPQIGRYSAKLIHTEPHKHTDEQFDVAISDFSPRFVKIYNQALTAESIDLDEIAGFGYRKALEFLIKDFCIHTHPSDIEKIKTLELGKCIFNYIENDKIQKLASRATWIGNDEAHYIRRHENRDVEDMKRFIEATVYFIRMSLAVEDAESISRA